jgi:hypothetical protein
MYGQCREWANRDLPSSDKGQEIPEIGLRELAQASRSEVKRPIRISTGAQRQGLRQEKKPKDLRPSGSGNLKSDSNKHKNRIDGSNLAKQVNKETAQVLPRQRKAIQHF